MNRQQIREKLVEVLRDIQVQGGYAAPEITDETRPLEDLEGFDSYLGVEVTSDVSRKFGISIPVGENVFKAKGVARPLALNEVVDVLASIAATSPAVTGGATEALAGAVNSTLNP